MKKTVKFNEFLEYIATHEDFVATLAEYNGMTKDQIKEILLTHGKNPSDPEIELIIDERRSGQTGAFLPTNYFIYIDGASRGNPGPSGAGAVIYEGKNEVARLKKYLGDATNNEAEYEALILGIKEAVRLNYFSVRVFSDSELMVNQVNGHYRVLDPKLEKLYQRAYKEIHKLSAFQISYLGRRSNKVADALANQAIDEGQGKK